MTTHQDTIKDQAAKRAAIALLTAGLASKSEVARMAGVSKQLMQHWAAEIDVDKARNAHLAKLWRRALKRR